jgi:thymidylate synthase (FAD)
MIEATEDFIPKTLDGLTSSESRALMETAVKEQLKGGLQLPLEAVSYTFAIGNVSRTCTHQIVRTRVGAGFSQQSLRWRNVEGFNFRMPATIFEDDRLFDMVNEYITLARRIHRELVDADIPYQDARFVIPMGMTTHLIATYNYRALRDFCATRLCNMVQWEINEVAKLMKKQVTQVHPILGEALMPRCEMIGKCTFAGWEKKCEEREYERDWTSERKGTM